MASNPITSWQIYGETMETLTDFIFLGSKITVDSDWSHETKRCRAFLVTQVVKESACNAGDLDSIPGSGRFPGKGSGNPLQCSCLENPKDGGAWWAAIYGIAQSQAWLMWLSSSSSSRLVITFPPRSKCHLIPWLQSPSAVILEQKTKKKTKNSATGSTVSLSICHAVRGPDAMIFVFWMLSFKPIFHSPLSLSSRGSSVLLHFLP